MLNFGVPGYGTDQALLRIEKQYDRIRSPTVLLCVLTENINRCVSVYGGFYRQGWWGTKPRFVLRDGRLELYNPFSTPDEVRDILLYHPERLIAIGREHDYWYQKLELFGRPWHIGFPYSLELCARVPYCLERLKVGLTDVDSYVPLYREGSEALEIMKGIMQRFRGFADKRHFKGLVVIFPRIRDARRLAKTGEIGYQALPDFLTTEGIPYIDLVDVIVQQPDIATLYVHGNEHLTRAGGEVVVPEILDFLRRNDALPGP